MAEGSPTYKVEQRGEAPHYTCVVPDAGEPGGICGHEADNLDFFTKHMEQRHAGEMIEAPAETPQIQPAEAPAAAPRRGQGQATSAAASESRKE